MILKDIPTDIFKTIIEDSLKDNWKKMSEYDGFDSWIDYGKIVLYKDGKHLVCEWDNWSEGQIQGLEEVLTPIREHYLA